MCWDITDRANHPLFRMDNWHKLTFNSSYLFNLVQFRTSIEHFVRDLSPTSTNVMTCLRIV